MDLKNLSRSTRPLFTFPLALAFACGGGGTTSGGLSAGSTTSGGSDPSGPDSTSTTTESGGETGGATKGSTSSASDPTTSTTAVTATDGTKFDLGAGETVGTGGDCVPPPADGTIKGTVYAPNQVIPVSGALVYASEAMPAGIPDHVYCAECVPFACDARFALTKPDGSFELEITAGTKFIVVQKGQFMRVTPVELAPGENALPVEVTSLPDHRDPAKGMFIPNIALALGEFDRLEDALGKLGLADTLIDPGEFTETFVEGTQEFDLWNNADGPLYGTMGSIADLVLDYKKLAKYHILFVPCSSDPFLSEFQTEAAQDNLRKWVAEGGKFYVADWSNEYLSAGFAQYQTFYQDVDLGGTDLLSPYDSVGTVLDDDMLQWLQALPPALKDINPINGNFNNHPVISMLPQLETVDSWSGVQSTPPVLVDDGMGGQVDVGHKTWIEGPGDGFNVPYQPNPLTITALYGCGKIMFTTYHMAEFTESYIGLTPQELVLLYLILEIGVCQEAYEPPPPPG